MKKENTVTPVVPVVTEIPEVPVVPVVPEVQEAPEVPEIEDRLNDYAITQFGVLGFTGRLPDRLVETYDSFKKRKDILMPGRLTPEGFATVILLFENRTIVE